MAETAVLYSILVVLQVKPANGETTSLLFFICKCFGKLLQTF